MHKRTYPHTHVFPTLTHRPVSRMRKKKKNQRYEWYLEGRRRKKERKKGRGYVWMDGRDTPLVLLNFYESRNIRDVSTAHATSTPHQRTRLLTRVRMRAAMLWLNGDVIDDPTNSWNWDFLLEITSRGQMERKEEERGHKKKNDLVIAQSVKVSKYASPTDAVIL